MFILLEPRNWTSVWATVKSGRMDRKHSMGKEEWTTRHLKWGKGRGDWETSETDVHSRREAGRAEPRAVKGGLVF